MKKIMFLIFTLILLNLSVANVLAQSPGPVASSPEGGPTTGTMGGNCVIKRSEVLLEANGRERRKHPNWARWVGDQVLWCPNNHPKIVSCNGIDDFAPSIGPTVLNNCENDGVCDASAQDDKRPGTEGPQNVYEEFVNKSSGLQGCWSYDRGGQHKPMRVEILCCK